MAKAKLSADELLDYIQQGFNIWQIADVVGCSSTTVRNTAKRNNIKLPKGFHNREGVKKGRPPGFNHSQDWKADMSRRFSGSGNPFYGKRHTDKTRKKMSCNHADFIGEKNPFKKSLSNPDSVAKHKARCKKIWKERDQEYRIAFGKKIQKGHGDISGTFWARVKSNAKQKGRNVTVSIEECWDIFLEQGGKCALSGLALEFGNTLYETTASLDRKDSNRGYEFGNVQWLHKHINLMNRTLPEPEFIKLCEAVAQNHELNRTG